MYSLSERVLGVKVRLGGTEELKKNFDLRQWPGCSMVYMHSSTGRRVPIELANTRGKNIS